MIITGGGVASVGVVASTSHTSPLELTLVNNKTLALKNKSWLFPIYINSSRWKSENTWYRSEYGYMHSQSIEDRWELEFTTPKNVWMLPQESITVTSFNPELPLSTLSELYPKQNVPTFNSYLDELIWILRHHNVELQINTSRLFGNDESVILCPATAIEAKKHLFPDPKPPQPRIQ